MLAASAEPTTQFTRRDAGRLFAASAVLVLAMSVILGLDMNLLFVHLFNQLRALDSQRRLVDQSVEQTAFFRPEQSLFVGPL